MFASIVGISLLLVAPSYQDVECNMGRTNLKDRNELNKLERTWLLSIKYKKDVINKNEHYVIHLSLTGGPDNEKYLLYTITNVSGSNLRKGILVVNLDKESSSDMPKYGTTLIILNGERRVAEVIKEWSRRSEEKEFQITAAIFKQTLLIESGTLPKAGDEQRRFKDYDELIKMLEQFCRERQSEAEYGTPDRNCNIDTKASEYVDSYSWSIIT